MKRKDRMRHKTLDLAAKLAPTNIFPGEWESIVPGEGFDFFQIRPYNHGDDLRKLHLPSLIREGAERIVDRVAQAQVAIYIYADFSPSMGRNNDLHFFSKADIRDTLIALIGFSAAKVYSPLGLCVFSDSVRHTFLPVMGDDNAHRIIRWSLEQDSYKSSSRRKQDTSGIKAALEHLIRTARSRSIVFIISDFLDGIDFFDELKKAGKIFDVVPIVVQSQQENRMLSMSESVRFSLRDSESEKISEFRIDKSRRERMRKQWNEHLSGLAEVFKRVQLDWAIVDSPKACFPRLQKVFAERRR